MVVLCSVIFGYWVSFVTIVGMVVVVVVVVVVMFIVQVGETVGEIVGVGLSVGVRSRANDGVGLGESVLLLLVGSA